MTHYCKQIINPKNVSRGSTLGVAFSGNSLRCEFTQYANSNCCITYLLLKIVYWEHLEFRNTNVNLLT